MNQYIAVYSTGQLCPVFVDHFEAESYDVAIIMAEAPAPYKNHWKNSYTLESVAAVIWTKDDDKRVVSDHEPPLYVVRFYDGFDNEWMTVSEPLPYDAAFKLCGDKNEARSGTAAGKRTGSYNDIDYYKVERA